MNERYIEEDEIDLRELFRTILKNKKFIIIFTSIITTLSIAFVLIKTPIFEAKSIIEIGSYKSANKDILLADSNKLVQKLNVLYIDILKNEKERTAWIENISIIKKQKSFISLTAYSTSNDEAKKELNTIINHIKTEHAKIIDEIVEKKNIELKDLERKVVLLKGNQLISIEEDIFYIKKTQLPSLKEKISTIQKKIENIKTQIKITNLNIIKTKSKDPSLTALNVIEKRSLESELSSLKLGIIDLKNSKEILISKTLPRLQRSKNKLLEIDLAQILEQKKLLEQSMLPHNYKNSEVVGNIMTNDYPIKPKKKLIVVTAFVTGFILSIFLVFFIEFIKNGRNEEKDKNSN